MRAAVSALPPHAAAAGRVSATEPCLSCLARPAGVCAAIPIDDLARLAALARPLRLTTGVTFIEEGESADSFVVIVSGTAKLFKTMPDGRRQITGFPGAGRFLGLALCGAYAFSAEALEPMSVCKLPRNGLQALMGDHPMFERRLLEAVSHELAIAQEQMLLLGRKTARERVASFLIEGAAERPDVLAQSEEVGGARVVHLPMTRADVADYLGVTIETISRTLTQFRFDRLIDVPSRSAIILRDRPTLAEIAAGKRPRAVNPGTPSRPPKEAKAEGLATVAALATCAWLQDGAGEA
jgi:CRP/FNR family transcriptional regulator